MFLIKKLIFKFMELGLGLRTCFSLETRNPVFVNFRLRAAEAEDLKRQLPPGFSLQKIRFCQSDPTPEYWVSYNLYEIKYPKKELEKIKKVRCEINTFVSDEQGRKGVLVFAGSPYVSKEQKLSFIGWVCDLAERMVVFIYGCGRLISLKYELTEEKVHIDFKEGKNELFLETAAVAPADDRLSDEYWLYNDISFFNGGKTFDLVNVNSAFYSAKFSKIPGDALKNFKVESPFVRGTPQSVYYHRGDIAYLVNSMNRKLTLAGASA